MKWVGGWIVAICLMAMSMAHARAEIADLCEVTMLDAAEAMERVTESYRGLLEFGGDEYSEARLLRLAGGAATLEDFFELLPVGDQRSVALNDSLRVLGDWVLLGEHEIDPRQLIARLREAVQAHLRSLQGENYRAEEARETLREANDLVRSFEPHGRYLIGADFVARDGWILSSGEGGVKLWEMTGEHEPTVFTDTRAERILLFPDGVRFLTYNRGSSRIRLWDIRRPKESQKLDIPFEAGFKGSIWAGGDFVLLAEGGRSGERRILNASTGRLVRFGEDSTLKSPYALSPDGQYVAIHVRDGQKSKIEIWKMPDPRDPDQSAVLAFRGDAPFVPGGMIFGRDTSELILVTGGEMSFCAYRITEGRLVPAWSQRVRRRFSGMHHLLWKRQGSQALIYAESKEILLLNPENGEAIQRLPHPAGLRVMNMKLSPTERYLVVGYSDLKTTVVWDLHADRMRARLSLPFRVDQEFKFSPDEGALLVLQPGVGQIQVWDLKQMDQN